MSVLTDLVLADESEAPSVGDALVPYQGWTGIVVKGIDIAKLAHLLAIVKGENCCKELEERFSLLYARTDHGPWVYRVPQELVEALAELDDHGAIQVAMEWSMIEPFAMHGWTGAAVEKTFDEIRSFANQAAAEGKSILMWVSS